ncbi:MAG: DUF4091 domain-containing protein [Clostridia bacterium]|nr:DUF4091 domain-containing protein [Clostridia bacterium]
MKKSAVRILILLTGIVLAAGLIAACNADRYKTTDPARVHADGEQIIKYFGSENITKKYAGKDGKERNVAVFETTASDEDPYIYFDYEAYVRSLGLEPVSADEYKYIVLKVKQSGCSDGTFELFFAAGDVKGATGGHCRTANFDNTVSGWQFLVFDLSNEDFHGTVHGFRFDYMHYSANPGEKFYFASMTFLKSASELSAFLNSEGKTDPHLLTAKEQKAADALLKTVTLTEAPNEKLTAANEDAGLDLWFDHMYTKTPAESTTSTGRYSYKMYLAKNEIEDCQFLLASLTAREGLTAKITPFTNASGDALRTELYYGYYFDDVQGKSIADPMPRLDGPFSLEAGKSKLFVIKLFTEETSKAGDYSATLTILDADGKEIKKAAVYAYVYDFSLPEGATCKTQMDLSWYAIYVNHELYEGDDGVMYKKYYNLMLENRICAYTLPYSDQGAYEDPRVQEYVANPRVVAFNPIGWKVQPTADNVSAAYRYLSQNPEWLSKAYFYHVDEPLSMEALNEVNSDGALFAQYFPGYHYLVPIHYDMALDAEAKTDFFEYVSEYVNSWCPHTFFYNTYDDYSRNPLLTYRVSSLLEKNLGTFPERMAKEQAGGDDVWWYVTRFPQSPEITISIETQAVRYRILFWQQKLYRVDNFLYYLVNDWFPATDASGQSDFGFNSKHEKATGDTPFDIYGNGVLLYSGHYLGIEEPIGSLRMECIRDGIEDYEYLTIFEKLYGEADLELIIKQVTTSLGVYTTDEEVFTRIRCLLGMLIEAKA